MARTPECTLVAVWILAGTCRLWAQPTITEYSVPTAASSPAGITTGLDGNLWFTESDASKIAKITTSGTITEFAIPTPNSQPWAITSGPDGNLWFTEISGNNIGKITTSGVITEYSIPSALIPGQVARPNSIAAGPDGNLWFTEPAVSVVGKIGKITTSGVISEYRAGLTNPTGITAGPDGNLWFTGDLGVGQISAVGVVTQFPLVVGSQFSLGFSFGLSAIAQGADGNLWIPGRGILWRISTSGVVTSFSVPADGGIAVGADGNLWLTDGTWNDIWNRVGKLTMAGVFTEYSIPTAEPQVRQTPPGRAGGLAPGPDGNTWFTEQTANKVGKLVLSTVPADMLLGISPSSLTFSQVVLGNAPPARALAVTASSDATYTASASTAIGPQWLTISPSGNLTGNQTFTVTLNKQFEFGAFGAYTGDLVFVSGNVTQYVPVTLNITRPVGPPNITAVVNAASSATGVIAPGEIISIFGTLLGPSSPLNLTLDSSGNVARLLGGVSVNFNGGFSAPLIFASATQIDCVVPYEFSGGSSATVQVFFGGQLSPPFALRVADTMPGIFTLNGSGTGQASAMNGSGGVNGVTNPAAAGSVVTFYVTGEGQTTPAGTTGGVTSPSLPQAPQPHATLNVTIGGEPAKITSYGEAPGIVAGIMKVSVQIPGGLVAGNQPMVVSLEGTQSQSGVTVSLQ